MMLHSVNSSLSVSLSACLSACLSVRAATRCSCVCWRSRVFAAVAQYSVVLGSVTRSMHERQVYIEVVGVPHGACMKGKSA